MKLGIMGSGFIIRDFFTFSHLVDGLEVVSMYARNEEKLAEFGKQHSIANQYNEMDAFFEDKEMEVVYVALPNHMHYQACKQALLAGYDVICEKPFTSNKTELEELVELAKKQGKILIEALTTHFLPNMPLVKESISSLGDIKIVTTNYSQYSSRYDAFKQGTILPAFDNAMSGGALMDLNVYNINFVVALFGMPKKVEYMANIEQNIDTSGIVTMDYGTFKAVCIGAKDCKAPVMSTIQGDKGNVMIMGPVSLLNDFTVAKNSDSNVAPTNIQGDEHRMYFEFVKFVEIMKTRDQAYVDASLKVSVDVMDVLTQARKSAGLVFPADLK
ncbi:Gfo/Idh/MocA family protein [Tannockella kyphosi]|uniref:Gfo/Idh/MocA family protein n=1 Tax=Tannockella kyphosi TaxID=2899121 RepID=UPI002013673C|nr:Gfo/Idh/MocA family oxidoreductase [Tannockella kyphosi]